MKPVKSLFICLVLMLTAFGLVAQDNDRQEIDIVELETGETLKGTIVSLKDGEYIELKDLETGVVHRYTMGEVKAIKQAYSPKVKAAKSKSAYEFRETGLFTNINFGFSFGKRDPVFSRDPNIFFEDDLSDTQYTAGFNIQGVVGHQFNRSIGLGGGLSFDAYDLEEEEAVLTLLAYSKGYLTKTNTSPFWAFSTGYGFALGSEGNGIKEREGGLMFHPEIGLRLGASAKTNFEISVGYRFQKAYYVRELPFNGDIQYKDIQYQRLLLSIGLRF